MITALSPVYRRALALGLLAMAVALVWATIVDPLVTFFRSSADDRWTNLRALSRDHALVAADPQVIRALASVSQSPRWARLYESQKPDQATLQMETEIKGLINTPNNPTSMTAEPPMNKGVLTRIAVKVTLSLSIDQLASALGRLQSASKLLQIDALTVQAPDYQPPDSNPVLSIQAEIVGYMVTPTGTRT